MKKTLLATLLFIGSFITPASTIGAAGNARISLSPSNGSYAQGSEFSTNVTINGTDINVIQIKLTYDASLLSCSSVSGSSVFSADIETNCSNGVVKISRYTTGTPVSGSQQVATVSFKALAQSGSASIKVDGSSKLASNGNNVWDNTVASASIAFTPQATAPVGGENPTPVSPTTTTSSSNTQASNRTKSVTPANSQQTSESPIDSGTTSEQTSDATDTPETTSEVLGSTDTIATTVNKSNRSWTPVIVIIALVAIAATIVKPRYAEIKAKISEITSKTTK